MRIFLLVCLTLLSGCTTLGNLEPLNDAGLEDVRKVFDAADKTWNVMGGSTGRNRAPTINRGYGHGRNMKTWPSNTDDVPHTVKGYIEAERYIRAIWHQW